MAGSLTKGEQNAAAIGDLTAAGVITGLTDANTFMNLFTATKITAGSATFNATSTDDTLAHGLGAAPDFVILQSAGEAAGRELTWSSDTTTLTVTRATTVAAEAWSYIIGILV